MPHGNINVFVGQLPISTPVLDIRVPESRTSGMGTGIKRSNSPEPRRTRLGVSFPFVKRTFSFKPQKNHCLANSLLLLKKLSTQRLSKYFSPNMMAIMQGITLRLSSKNP
ncbi:11728_t:CDS:2 [Entrophospora sp. SA101]|nr:11728_t:CDS:2 [Entrophospora sp. SA101]